MFTFSLPRINCVFIFLEFYFEYSLVVLSSIEITFICHPGLNRLYDWRAIKDMFYLQLSFYTKINRSRLIATLADGYSSVFFAHKFWFWGNFYPGGVG